jgi:nitrogen fixation/metabolism regulation signal transduction histidine kinase
VATGLAITLAILVAAYTIRPLKQLTNKVQQFSSGNPGEISSTSRKDEIGRLQHAFPRYVAPLQAQIMS